MGISQQMTGTPWHVERMVREEGDERRHRARCTFYRRKPDGHCEYYGERCRGSAHCERYAERSPATEKPDAMPVSAKGIPATIESAEVTSEYNKLRTLGTLVWIKKTAEVGEVIGFDHEKVRIRLDSGEEVSYNIRTCVSMKAIRIL